ncbi:MAG: tRNA (N6-threonylcarbamoyladenosine(37)-N6)-methyltransferase TrmO, partial [Thermoanaerobaculales bacterium]|nr:tRNA (N6-threonylcarbamoyladenosine(37)-N6)-methyltransferase TrmO [Thermoanaerobaculales bacterium]
MIIEYEPIGIVHSPFIEQNGTPIQPSKAKGARGTIELDPEYAEGLSDLDGFSHIYVLFHLHRSEGFKLKVVPYLDTVPRGLFATRAPRRPNPIGLSIVDLIGIDGNILTIENLDMLDGTPVLDIKPFVDQFDERREVRTGWLAEARAKRDRAD